MSECNPYQEVNTMERYTDGYTREIVGMRRVMEQEASYCDQTDVDRNKTNNLKMIRLLSIHRLLKQLQMNLYQTAAINYTTSDALDNNIHRNCFSRYQRKN
ncbi:hypothetical protein A3Q56_07028 [Intoshia linei]|uniref:Uncharacterized protein n=1 Tax=Intoshia linei TaxID=1819745 RepID=A0A177ATB9_9BILA|nr:hypothetical protein A3Q56_07028 [Intoshia linei]